MGQLVVPVPQHHPVVLHSIRVLLEGREVEVIELERIARDVVEAWLLEVCCGRRLGGRDLHPRPDLGIELPARDDQLPLVVLDGAVASVLGEGEQPHPLHLAERQGHQALPVDHLHALRLAGVVGQVIGVLEVLEPHQIRQGRDHVDRVDDPLDDLALGQLGRVAHQERDAQVVVVHEVVLPQPVLAEGLAVVRGHDHDRVVEHALSLELVQHLADHGVRLGDPGVVQVLDLLHVRRAGRDGALLDRDAVLRVEGRELAVVLRVAVHLAVLGRRVVGRVRRVVVHHRHEASIAEVAKPVDRRRGDELVVDPLTEGTHAGCRPAGAACSCRARATGPTGTCSSGSPRPPARGRPWPRSSSRTRARDRSRGSGSRSGRPRRRRPRPPSRSRACPGCAGTPAGSGSPGAARPGPSAPARAGAGTCRSGTTRSWSR